MNHKRKSNLLVLLIITVTVLGLGFLMSAMADESTAPSHNKSLTVNSDGTYEIALDVTGSADTTSSTARANVLLVYDISGSMTSRASSATGAYGLVNDNYTQLYKKTGTNSYSSISDSDNYSGEVYYRTGNNWTGYTYHLYEDARYPSTNITRAASTEKATRSFVEALLKYNEGQSSTDDPNVQLALVTFSTTATTRTFNNATWTTSNNIATWFNNNGTSYRNNTYGGVTNWEGALEQARTVLGSADEDPTYVVFITDGAPTYSNTHGNEYGSSTSAYYNVQYYRDALDEALSIKNYNTKNHTYNVPKDSNTEIYGIYAFGTEADNLDDLIYYAHNGKERPEAEGGVTANSINTPYYYNASDSTALNKAIADIFADIVDTAGIGKVSISDGTTQTVKTSSGDLHLLKIDESSYKYWLSMIVVGNNGNYTMTRTDLISGKDYTINVHDNGNGTVTCTWTDTNNENHTVTVEGSVELNTFKYKWTGKNDLYDFDPPTAKLNGSSVDWDLSKLGTLLDGVTYTVTFDVWPTQDTYDLISDLKNGIKTYEGLDANIKKYLISDDNGGYTLRTNTSATLTYTDTRNSDGEQTVGYKNPDPVKTPASEMTVKKLWDNALDKRTTDKINLNVTKDKSKYGGTLELSNSSNPAWESQVFISTGLMSVTKDAKGNPTKAIIRESGHDYTFEEVGDESYYWDLTVETVRPMIINGTLTNLVKVEENAPSIDESNVLVKNGVTYYKIGNSVYYVREQEEAVMNATNTRRSNLNIKKITTGEAPANSEFTFTVKVDDSLKNDVWFSIYDNNASATVMDETVVSGNVTKEMKEGSFTGYYYAPTGTTITMKLKANWNVRFTNLPTGSTYTIEETSMPEGFIFDESNGTNVTIITNLLPTDAVANEDGTYTSNNVTYTPVKDEEGNITHYTYEGNVTKAGRKLEGEIYVSNTSYQAIYTNEYTLTNITATKVWDDDNNRAGFRSDELNVTLSRNGETINTQTLNETNKWTYTWKNLPKFDANGTEYKYAVTEGEVNSKYSTKYEGKVSYDIKAKPTSEKDEYTVELLANGNSTGKTVTLNKENNWTSTINNVDYIDKNGNIITYTTSLGNVRLYSQDKNITITNSYTPETVDIPVKKVWDDSNNQDGKRPTSVTVQLQANGTNVTGKTATITSANNWTYIFEDLDKYLNGSEVRYTVVETNVEGYTTTYSEDTLTITNTHKPETFDYEVKKTWRDDNNRDRLRPQEITVKLIDDDENEVKSIVVKASENWAGIFEDVPKYKNGEPVTYTVVEEVPTGYTASYSYNAVNTKATINNIHDPEPTSVTVTKTWSDNNNQDGIRPSKITVKLLANGTEVDSAIVIPDAQGNWTYTFSDLNKKENGTDIVYTVQENTVPGYTTVIDGTSITNTLTSPEKTSLTVTKEWSDNNNQDNLRTPVTVKLLKDGKTTDKTITLNETNNWTATFTDLEKNRDGGTPIIYTVEEVNVEGYTTTIDYDKNTATITNTLTNPEKTTFTVEKVWNDDNNRDGLRKELTVHLYADNKDTGKTALLNEDNHYTATFTDLDKNNNGRKITYTVKEDAITGYTTTYDYETKELTGIITNTHTIDKTKLDVEKVWNDDNNRDNLRTSSVVVTLVKNGTPTDKTVTLSAANDWSDSFTNLEKNENGALITYTVQESSVTGYITTYQCQETKCTVTNTHNPETTTFAVTKIWNDDENRDGIRPTNILLTLYADGVETTETVTLNSKNNWTYTFLDLPKNNNGRAITYSVKEANITGYTSTVASNGSTATVTNTHTAEVRDITVTKTWADNNNQDGIRPTKVTVNLLANGEVDRTVELTAENNWSYKFSNLPKNKDGKLITYTVQELTVKGYTTTINGFEITNTLTNPEKTSVEGEKIWADNNNQDGIRPERITVNLLADGEKVDSQIVTSENNWKYSFTNLDKNKAGKEIVYTVTENKVEGYTTTIDGTTITNTLTNPEKTKLDVEKVWKDNNNQDNLRSESIEVILVKNGTETTNTLTLNEDNSWKGTFSNLDKNENGKKITYTVKEVSVEGYTTTINYDNTTSTITNTLTNPEKTSVEGEKIWADNNNQDGIRPERITVNLLADGEKVDSQIVTSENNWKYSFTNLDKNKAGKEIVYTVTENKVEGYTTTIDGTTITNTLTTPEKTKLDVEKVWNDKNNQDGVRPESIEVTLYADGANTGKTLTLNQENSWKGTFSNLDKNKEGKAITYTVEENELSDYERTITYDNNKATIVNRHNVEKTSVSGTKTWADNNNQDNIRPTRITVNLYADGVKVDSKTIEETNGTWTYSFTDLDKNKGGKEIVYTIKETSVDGYTTTYDGFNITNTHDPYTTSITGSKTWKDNNNQDGTRPESITVRLLADGKEVANTTATASSDWTYTFSNLPKYNDGKKITYTVTEDEVEGYTTKISDYDITNIHQSETTEVSGTKTWIDNDNQDGIRPERIIINLLANGEKVDNKVVTEKNGTWEYSFTDLPKYENGEAITYTVEEVPVDGYTTTIDGYNITNTHEVGTTSVTGTKTWKDNNNQDGIRPESITIRLYAEGKEVASTTATASSDWTYTFSNLPKYNDGKKITYTVKEDEVPGYTTKISDYDITNTHKTEIIEVSGTKTWNDNNNQDGIRPESITVRLYANGERIDSKIVRETNGTWIYKFTDLPKYENGKEIVYTVSEKEVDGYTTTIDGYNITNTYKPETTTVTGTKTWKDNNNQDGLRPESITVRLYANGEEVASTTATSESDWNYSFSNLPKYNNGKKITYTITEDVVAEYATKIEDFDIINTHKPGTTNIVGTKTWDDNNNQDGIRPERITVYLYANGEQIDKKVVTEKNGTWNYQFTDLPKYENGALIVYTVSEKEVDGYTTAIDGYNIINTLTNPETTKIDATKVWNDNNNQDGIRPETITVTLYADNTITDKQLILSKANNWTGQFVDLDKNKDGKAIVYTVKENEIEGYTTSISCKKTACTIENTLKNPEKITIEGEKIWEDNNNQDGTRPDKVTITLYGDGEKINTAIASNKTNWKYAFTDLDKNKEGKAIVYTVKETPVTGYTTKVDGFTITNTYAPETTSITGTKTWKDNNNQDGIRPASITVRLYADGKEVDSIITSAESGWNYSFNDLPKYNNGKKITYTVNEDEVVGYTTQITDYDIINTHKSETVEVNGTKTWIDENNRDGVRPNRITINLLADGEKVDTTTTNTSKEWKYSFINLPKYKEGKEITYTVEEVPVDGYVTTIDGFNITNKHIVGTTSVTGKKTWKDANDNDGIRPEKITVNLLADGEKIASQEIDNTTNWKYTFANLAEYKDGKKINYTIEEVSIEGYVATIDGYNIINTHKPELTEVTGTKTWADDNNRDGIRPNRITVYLYANGTKIDTTVVTPDEEGNWNYTFDNLPKYENGALITYTVSEKEVKGYKASVEGTNITNTHEIETKDITGTKTWNDDNNRDGLRPESITVHLYADEVEVASQKVTADTNWNYTFSKIPVYKDGELITYSISEDEVAGYIGEVNGSNITNTHTPITKDITVTKQWVDNNNQDNMRPSSIHINLLANGSLVKSADITSEDIKNNLWTYTFTDLPVNENGKLIVYSITEDKVTNYDTKIEGFNIINTHNPNKIHIKGEKTWDDEENIYGRPESIKVTLKRSVGEKTFEPITKEVTEKDDWKYDFGEFPEYYEGKLITYQVEEAAVRDYTTVIEGYNIKNIYTPETISISGTKTWEDASNQDGLRPESITVELYANGEKVKETKASEESDWKYTFDNLVKYANGTEITYTIKEASVDGYTTELTDYNITNHHTPETLTYNVRKVWEDYNNNDNLRPDFITVTLYKELTDGKKAIVEVVKMSEDNNWSYSFKELPRYYQGEEITYTIVEDTVYGYVTNISSEKIHDENTTKVVINSTIINTHEKEITEVSGTKTWEDDDNYDGLRPDEIKINLYADGELLETRSVTSEDNWTYSFKDLEKYHDGELIHYTIDESDVFGYRKEIQNYNVTNIHNHEVISISLKKTWVDNDDADGLRPESIKVKLYADGEYLDTITITSANNWQYIINNLDKYKNGKIINYTIEEELVNDYTTIYDGYNIINIHNPGTGGDPTPPTPPAPPKKYIEVTPPKTGVNDGEKAVNFIPIIVLLLGLLVKRKNYNN